jgi:hypothetical protein
MKTLKMFLLLLAVLMLSLNSQTAFAGSCGIVPIKPIPPIGCKDLAPQCVCDSNGQNCYWTWVCVK